MSRVHREEAYLHLGQVETTARLSGRRRLLVWAGVLVALFGSVLVLFLTWQQAAADLRLLIESAASRHRLDPDLVEAVVYAESHGNAEAVSRAQAYGLMQLRIPTASEMAGKEVTVDDLLDPRVNLELGCRYLRHLIDRYDGDLLLTLMAYNAGPGRVAGWRAQQPDPKLILKDHAFGETRLYVRKVLAYLRERKA